MNNKTFTLFDPALVVPALREAFRKLSPAVQWRNPVMFVVYVGSILTTLLAIQALGGEGEAPAGFIVAITVWLWFTVLFANFAVGKCQTYHVPMPLRIIPRLDIKAPNLVKGIRLEGLRVMGKPE